MCMLLLELLHPDGTARRVSVIGSNCPQRLFPRPLRQTDTSHADIVIFAPTAQECQRRDWLSNKVATIPQQLAADGIAYILAPPQSRWTIRRMLRESGLILEPPLVHLPSWSAALYIIPLSVAPYAIGNILVNPALKRRLALLGLRSPPIRAAFRAAWPWIGFAARRPGSRAMFDWLFRLDGSGEKQGTAMLSVSWQADLKSVLIHGFSTPQRPSLIAKLSLHHNDVGGRAHEADILQRFGALAGEAGANIPTVLSTARLGNHPLIIENVVPGQSVAALLRRDPSRINDILPRVTSWLENWNASTSIKRHLDTELVQQWFLQTATRLASLIRGGDAYQDWLAHRCAELTLPIPLVVAHNDLTTWNILVDEDGRPGIVDWDTARESCLPLVDFFYMVVDAVSMSHGGPSHFPRHRALEASFAPTGSHASIARALLRQLQHVLEVPDEILDLCCHGAFLSHALNEHLRSGEGDPRPFRDLVQWLADNRELLHEWMTY